LVGELPSEIGKVKTRTVETYVESIAPNTATGKTKVMLIAAKFSDTTPEFEKELIEVIERSILPKEEKDEQAIPDPAN
jgi:hypothetical protein